MEKLFNQTLSLADPWAVTGFGFRPAEGAIHLTAERHPSSLPCHACGALDQPNNDRLNRRWQHLHCFQFRAFSEARVSRVARSQRNKTPRREVPRSPKGSSSSAVREALVIVFCKGMQAAQVARLLGLSVERVWCVLEHYIRKARAAQPMASMSKLILDETSGRRGALISAFFDAEPMWLEYSTPDRNAATIWAFVEDLHQHGDAPEAIADVSMDMSKSIQAGARAQGPQARISFDHFHILQVANAALDRVRSAETRCATELKGCRCALLKLSKKWSSQQTQTMQRLQRSGLQTARVWRLKEASRKVFRGANTRAEAEPLPQARTGWTWRRRLTPFKRFGRTLKDQLEGILGHVWSGLNNGVLKSMNELMQAAKSWARGYRADQRLDLIVYLACSKLRRLHSNAWRTAISTPAWPAVAIWNRDRAPATASFIPTINPEDEGDETFKQQDR